MIDHLLRDLQVLRKADFLIAKIWANVLARRFELFTFAALIAVFGLGMANVAGFYGLQPSVGAMWAAATVAIADLLIAVAVLVIGSKSHPGPELDLALEVRKMAIDSIQEDAQDLKLAVDSLRQEIKNVRTNIAQLVHNPLDLAAQKVLISRRVIDAERAALKERAKLRG